MIKTPLSTMVGGAFWTPSCTVIESAQKTLDQLIKSMFANSEQGFTRTPDDLTILYQDAAGTTPVTSVGQPIGLVLDKSKLLALGSELNTNDFNTNLTGWAVGTSTTAVIENSEAKVTFGGVYGGGTPNWFRFVKNYVIGKLYQISFDATYVSGGDLQVGLAYTIGKTVSASQNAGIKQRYSFTCGRASAETSLATFGATTVGSVWKIDNVSVKEVLGNHAYQTTSSMRPLLQNTPRRIDYDAVDDKLITTLPAQLSGCTVILAVPNVGTQILINQTIATPYNDSTDHCGLIVINRALTAIETAQITRLFNKAAGV